VVAAIKAALNRSPKTAVAVSHIVAGLSNQEVGRQKLQQAKRRGLQFQGCFSKIAAFLESEGFEMAYIVQAQAGGPDGTAVSATVHDRSEALKRAVVWLGEGRTGVTIIGDGRVYTAPELATAIGIAKKPV
jgi:Ethanolamine utilization protein EutJ (predicted chaperonin)